MALVAFTLIGLTPAHGADVWYKVNSATLAWDRPTFEDGTPVPTEEVITYLMFIKNDKTGAEVQIGSTTELTLAVVLPAKGWYRFGVQATMEGVDPSPVAWSSDPAVCANQLTFGLRWLSPKPPTNLRVP